MDNRTIFVAQPDQSVTGMVLDAPLGTTLPTGFDPSGDIQIDPAFVGSGYVSEDGVSLSPSWETTALKDMSGSTVRTMLDEFTGEITFSLMNILDEKSAKQVFGEGNVQYQKAVSGEKRGNLMTISIGATLPPERSWIFKMKDGNAKVVIVVPKGQITALDSIEFNKSNSANLPATLTCTPDSNGKSIYIYANDGQVYTDGGSGSVSDEEPDGNIVWADSWDEMKKGDIIDALVKAKEKGISDRELGGLPLDEGSLKSMTKQDIVNKLTTSNYPDPTHLKAKIDM